MASIVAIAVKLVISLWLKCVQVGSLKQMHSTGFLHSDVKPNNVVFDLFAEIEDLFQISTNGSLSINENAHVYLLDFGLSERYLRSDGSHIPFDKINRQLGNKFFMSLSQLKKNGT